MRRRDGKDFGMIQVKKLFSDLGCIVEGHSAPDPFALNRDDVRNLLKEYGAVFFRSFDINVEEFKKFSDQCCSQFMSHSYALARNKFEQFGKDTTITEVTIGQNDLALHGEMYHSPDHPEVIWFYCQHPASVGGETTLADAHRLYGNLSPTLQKLFEEKKLRYKHFDPRQAWEIRYGTESINDVMALLKSKPGVENVSTDDNGTLIFDYITAAVRVSKFQGKKVFLGNLFINKNPANRPDFDLKKFQSLPNIDQAAGAKKQRAIAVEFEDGSEISDAILQEIHEVGSRITLDLRWQAKDFVMVDNTRVLHGRRAFQGKRVIATRIASAA
jgi:alpha-ketoglutarate-dependent taurine dioxygenase